MWLVRGDLLIPIRPEVAVLVLDLPPDLTRAEATRIARVIAALAKVSNK